MKITHVTPGLITIPPNGWGAIEKVIWNYHLNLLNQGHESEIKYLNDVDTNSDIIHIHVANLALEAHEKGIPYVFSLHDHHVVEYGRNSELYNKNLEAIKHSIISFCHAEFLVDYFVETDKLFYLSHGVDTNFFDYDGTQGLDTHKLLCLANNGFAYNQSIDRKGFRYAIEAAKALDLEITVAGPDNNKNFFNANSDLLGYEKLNIVYGNPDEESIKKLYNTHSIFLHPSILEAGHPNLTLLEAMACGLPTVGTYEGTPKIAGLRKIERDVDSVISGIQYVVENYDNLIDEITKHRKDFDWSIITNRLIGIYESIKIINKNYSSEESKNLFIKAFNETEITYREPRNNISFYANFIKNPTIEIKGNTTKKFKIEFWSENNLLYRSELGANMWSKMNTQYFKNYTCKIYDENNLVFDHKLNLKNKKVYIALESKSLGDTLAWFPQCEEFRKKHECELVVSTFMNNLFIDQYPNIEFINPGQAVYDLYAMYRIGWFYNGDNVDYNMNPSDFRNIPLQKTASDILGLEYNEVKAKLKLPVVPKRKKVGIGFHSTAQAKYWNNPEGWQDIVDYLNSRGYECVIYSKEGDGYMNNFYPKNVSVFRGGSIQEVINDLVTCEFFIGLGSGLSWLAWSCNLPVILISGFSEKYAEMETDCYRVINESVCHGCFNSERLDAGDWNWCPLHKNTTRMFECTKEISSDMVIKEINKIINKEVMEEKIDEVSFDWGGRSDWYIKQAEEEIFEGNTYERFFEVEEGDIVVDLGASLGPFTYKILPKNPKQCYVVEPISRQIEILKRNVGQENVRIIQGAITDKKKIKITWDDMTEIVPTFSFREFLDEYKINNVDFLKCDCEGGEYDVFQPSNIEFLKTIPKIVTEFHLRDDENFHQCKFRWFRDNILSQFDNIQVFSVDGVNIKWDLWNEHFIEYYNEVIIYIDNR
jgi:autotransporter strand-loop-strand O-heptosyltransferase